MQGEVFPTVGEPATPRAWSPRSTRAGAVLAQRPVGSKSSEITTTGPLLSTVDIEGMWS
jgi:hypothetical protein